MHVGRRVNNYTTNHPYRACEKYSFVYLPLASVSIRYKSPNKHLLPVRGYLQRQDQGRKIKEKARHYYLWTGLAEY
jgi:hypothetical protein